MIDLDRENPRDQMIDTARQHRELQRAEETRIMQKVNAAHRVAFKQKFPGQIEHILRLIAERLQQGLRKDQPDPITDESVDHLSRALYNLYQIHNDLSDTTGQ